MAGNKSDNGVHEIGTNDILASYQADTPGEIETKYLDNVNEYIKKGEGKKKEQVKAHFSMIFGNPLQGYPYNEQYGMDKTLEEGPKLAQIVRKHKAALMKAKKTGDLILPDKAEEDLSIWAMNNGEIHGDEEDEFIDWLDNNLDDLVPTLKIR